MADIEAAKLFGVTGLVAVVTGGGTGIGLMITKALALNGAHRVYIIGRRKEVLESAAKESPHGNIIPIVGDVTSKDSLEAAANQVKSEVGYINLLVANSGVMGPIGKKPVAAIESLEELQTEMWNLDMDAFTNTLHVNDTAVFFTTIAFLGLLDAGNKKRNVEQASQVIATSSIVSFMKNVPNTFAYNISKAACTRLVQNFATTLTPYDIRANAICPGLFPSEMTTNMLGDGPIPKDRIPAQRFGNDQDIAGTILYLASKAGAYVNGGVMVVDGGRLLKLPTSF